MNCLPAGRNSASGGAAVVGEEVCGGGDLDVGSVADAPVIVLLEAGLQHRHLGHGGIDAGARNALQKRRKRMFGKFCKYTTDRL